MPDPRHEFLTVREVAKLLRISKNTVYAEIKAGKLRAVHSSVRCTRILRADLDCYLNAVATTKPPKRPT